MVSCGFCLCQFEECETAVRFIFGCWATKLDFIMTIDYDGKDYKPQQSQINPTKKYAKQNWMHSKCFCWAKNICKPLILFSFMFQIIRTHSKQSKTDSAPLILQWNSLFALLLSSSPSSCTPQRSLCVGNKFSFCWSTAFYSIRHNSWNSFVVGLRSLCFVQRADFISSLGCFVDTFCQWKKTDFLLWKKVINDEEKSRRLNWKDWSELSLSDCEWKLINLWEIWKEKIAQKICQSAKIFIKLLHLIISKCHFLFCESFRAWKEEKKIILSEISLINLSSSSVINIKSLKLFVVYLIAPRRSSSLRCVKKKIQILCALLKIYWTNPHGTFEY